VRRIIGKPSGVISAEYRTIIAVEEEKIDGMRLHQLLNTCFTKLEFTRRDYRKLTHGALLPGSSGKLNSCS
jgi:hypothetical protein